MSTTSLGNHQFDIVCVGAGIVGLATAMTLAQRYRAKVAVIEAEKQPAQHQTGRNSGVIHSGLYYKPGSSKAKTCVDGRRRLLQLCDQHNVPYELCGKLVIATDESELSRLDDLHQRGLANGLQGLRRVDSEDITKYEPHAVGVSALWVPETGIVDYKEVANLYGTLFQEEGGSLLLGARLRAIQRKTDALELETTQGSLRTRFLINCSGLQCDRVARMAGAQPKIRIVPFRGDYFDLAENRRDLLRGLIYPVPDPRFPFLGVHLTKRIDGSVEAGPNAVLSLHREGYGGNRFKTADAASSMLYPGLWKLGLRYWKIGLAEYLRAGSPQRFAKALQAFVPEVTANDLASGGCGIRAQALDRKGKLLDDFAIERSERALHVLNAPSPAATASLSIADQLCSLAAKDFDLALKPT